MREPGRAALPHPSVSGSVVMGLVSGLSSADRSDSESCLAAHALLSQDGRSERILGGGQTHGVSLRPFPDSSGWWWRVSSVFLTGTSCREITHADGHPGPWPGWAVSISVPPQHTSALSCPSECARPRLLHHLCCQACGPLQRRCGPTGSPRPWVGVSQGIGSCQTIEVLAVS